MLKFAIIFLVLGAIAALLGFTSIAGASFAIAKILFVIFLIGFLIFLALGVFAAKKVTGN